MPNPPFVAFTNPLMQPAMRQVIAITNAVIPTVTTKQPHLYITGTIVRMYVPSTSVGKNWYGMPQIQHQQSEITVTGASTFTLNDINTLYYDAFVIPASPTQYAQVVPIGENNKILTAAEHNILG